MLSSPTTVAAKVGAMKSLYTHLQDSLVSTSSFWDPRLHASVLLESTGFCFVDSCGTAMDFLQHQPALHSPQVSATGFVIKTHFLLEKVLFGYRHSQNQGIVVSESFSSKG